MLEELICTSMARTRKRLDLKQNQIEVKAEMAEGNYGKYERGEMNPTLSTVWRIEQALSLPRYTLFNENAGIEGAEPCYETLNRFARHNIFVDDDTPNTEPSPLLDLVSDALIEKFTLEAIELMAEE